MAQRKLTLLTGVSAIDAGIRELKGIVGNVNERVQQLACSIIAHDMEHGDCSRALALVNTLPQSFRREYLVRWFSYFGNIGIDLKGQKVRHHAADTKAYRKPDIDGAKVNNWYEPFDANGNKADWYEGPNPAVFEPNTYANFGDNIVKFADRTLKSLDATKDNGRGVEVRVYDLTAEQRQEAEEALDVLKKLGIGIMAGERIAELQPLADMGERIKQLVGETEEETSETDTAETEETTTPEPEAAVA